MIDLYWYPSPNGLKVAIMLEECQLPYRTKLVDITRGAQFDPQFLKISPNNKIPAIVDHGASGGSLSLFESGAILAYLAEKTGLFLPLESSAKHTAMQWLFWQVGGLGPMAGQAHHFRAFASEHVPYGIARYTQEVNRLYGVLDRQLAIKEFVADDYSIADMAIWPWIKPHERQGQDLADFPALRRWFDAVGQRPAVRRALELGDERRADEEGHRHLYGQTAASVAAASSKAGAKKS